MKAYTQPSTEVLAIRIESLISTSITKAATNEDNLTIGTKTGTAGSQLTRQHNGIGTGLWEDMEGTGK